jgi:hypothetical protein
VSLIGLKLLRWPYNAESFGFNPRWRDCYREKTASFSLSQIRCLKQRGMEMFVHRLKAVWLRAKVFRLDGRHGRKPDGRIHRARSANPIREAGYVYSMPNPDIRLKRPLRARSRSLPPLCLHSVRIGKGEVMSCNPAYAFKTPTNSGGMSSAKVTDMDFGITSTESQKSGSLGTSSGLNNPSCPGTNALTQRNSQTDGLCT